MKKILATIIAVASFATVFAGCSSSASNDKFIVGFDSEFPPMGFVDDNGSYVGFDLDLAQETAQRFCLRTTLMRWLVSCKQVILCRTRLS